MGVSTEHYRQAIGLFNRVKYVRTSHNVTFITHSMLLLSLLLISLLLFISGVEPNPGPNPFCKLKHLRVCHVNIRGLKDKINDIKTSLCNYDIITLSETWLSSTTSNTDLALPGFQEIIRRDRPTFAGGVAVYVREGIAFKRLCDLECQNIEHIWLQVCTLEGKLLICTVYRPPSFNDFWDVFDFNFEQTKQLYPEVKYFLFLGDMNADFKTVNGSRLIDFCNDHNLSYIINEPTRRSLNHRTNTVSESCLDQILVNMSNFVKKSSVSPPISSDHCTVSIDLNFKVSYEAAYTRHIWLYQEADFNGFKHALQCANWDECFESDDVNVASERWSQLFLNTSRNFIPNKVVLVRPKDAPWFNNTLRKFRRKVHRLFSNFKKNPNTNNWERYTSSRNSYKHALDSAHQEYRESIAKSLTNSRNEKQWWNTVKGLLGKGSEKSYPLLKDDKNNRFISDSQGKATLFNNFYLSHTRLDTKSAQLPVFEKMTDKCLLKIVATEENVSLHIKSLDINKATGHDGISAKMIKEAGDSVVPSLTKLINMSLDSSTYPNSWKKALVTPIYKKSCKEDINNYRPVSILPVISKIAERIVFNDVYNYLHRNKLISKHQSGFRPNDSTVNQLAFMYNEFCDALDKKKDVRIVFCDVSKAFDKVWHRGIIFKLKQLGVDGPLLTWFENYLNNRMQKVVIKGQSSDWGMIEAGVPQGSVLGPLLFIVYINDLADVVDCNIKMFADDTCLYIEVDNPENAASTLSRNLENVSQWANQWLVTFNASKTKSMVISNKNVFHEKVMFNDAELDDATYHKHLGLTFTKNLSWTSHIDNIIKSASKLLDVSRKLQYQLDRTTLETIYKVFIRPKLEYGCQIWDDCNEGEKDKLERFQISALRVVTGAKKGTSHLLLYNETNWPTLAERRKNVKLMHMHKMVHDKLCPSYLSDLVPKTVGETTHYELRDSDNLRQFRHRGDKYKRSFMPDCVRLWNSLDVNLREIEDKEEFKENVIPVTVSNELYRYGPRKLNVTHTQLRLQCSNLKAHLVSLHVINDPQCACSSGDEDNFHFFFMCPLYLTQRQKLAQDLNGLCEFTLANLLHGDENVDFKTNCKIFDAVHSFIELSDRF